MRDVGKGKRVLHLRCSSRCSMQDRLNRGSLLHRVLSEEAEALYGIDIDGESIAAMRDRRGLRNPYVNDPQGLEALQLDETSDVVVADDLIDHLTCPGALLDGVRPFVERDGQLIFSTISPFGLHFHLRRWMGTYWNTPNTFGSTLRKRSCICSSDTIIE